MSRADRIRLHEAGRALAAGASAAEGAPVFELADALVDFQTGRLLERVCRSQEGAELVADRLVVDAKTCDFRDLLRLPYGTFGHEYAQWMIDHGLHPDLHRDVPATGSDERYLAQRVLEVHDLWHVLSGYNCDAPGELGLLAFTLGQIPQRGIASVLLASVHEDLRLNWRDRARPWSPLIPYLWRAFWHGRHARFLVSIAIEDYFWLPIGSVRQRLDIEPSECALTRDALPPIAVSA